MNAPQNGNTALQNLRCSGVISIIIPTLNDERRLVPTLAALVSGAAAGLIAEAIVADGGSSDETEAVADIAGCRFLKGPAARGERLAAAAEAARAPWLMFMVAGMVLDEGWTRDVRAFLDGAQRRNRTDRVAAFGLAFDDPDIRDRLEGFGAGLMRLAGFGPDPRQGLIVSRERYRALGGHDGDAGTERRFARRAARGGLTVLRSRVTSVHTE